MQRCIDADENSYVSKEDLEIIDGYVTKDDMYRLISRHKPYIGQENANRMCEAVLHMPSADIEPVRHGRWIDKGGDSLRGFECSACGVKRYVITKCMKKPIFDFCPFCGAKMDGGKVINDNE